MSGTDLTLTPAELRVRLDGFVREHLRDNSEETIGTYRRSLRAFLAFVDEEGTFSFDPRAVRSYRASLVERNLSPSTVSTYLTALRRFCDYLVSIGLLRTNPASDVRGGRRPPDHSRRPLAVAEVDQLLEHLSEDDVISLRDRAIVHCMLYAGLAEIELVRADVRDLDQTLVGAFLRVQGKGRSAKDSQVPLDEVVHRAVSDYLRLRKPVRPEDPLFVAHSHRTEGSRLNTRTIRARVNALLREAGLKVDRVVSPHSLTHTAPLLWLQAGMPLEEVRKRMRHGTIDTTLIHHRKHTAQQEGGQVSAE